MKEELRYRVSEARSLAGMTQQEAADGMGMTLQGYQYYEYGNRDMKASVIKRMCALFGCSATFLLGMDYDEEAEEEIADAKLTEIINAYRTMDPDGRDRLHEQAVFLCQKYTGEKAETGIEKSA